MIKLDAIINDKRLLASIQKGVDTFNRSKAGKSKLNLKINEKGFRQPLGRITGDLDKFEGALAASNARVIAFGASTAVIGGISQAFKVLATTTILVQKQFADINRILQISNKEFSRFSDELFGIGKKTATAFEDVAKAALEFGRQGLKTEEVLKRTADALTLVRLTGVNAEKAVSSLTATVNAFQKSALTTTSAINKFVAVETQFAVSARDLMEALGRVGSSAVDAKVGFDELNATVAAVQQQTGRGGAVIGNAMKTIFTRLQRQDTLKALESYNIAVRDIEGNTLPAMRILKSFASTYETLEDSSKAYLREQVAGVFQANILSALVKDLNSDYQVYNRALEVSVGATDQADMANQRLNRTLSALLSQTGTELTRLQENVGKITFEPIARAILGPFKSLTEGINNLLDGEGIGSEFANGFLKGLRNIIAGPGIVAAVSVIGITVFKTLSYITKALPTLVGITSETQKRAKLEATISAMLSTDVGLTQKIAAAEGNAAVQAGILVGAAQKAETAFAAQAITTAAIARNLAAAGMTTNKMGAIVPRGRGAFGRGASGFIPGVTGEMHDIRRGIGGVSSSARPVHIPNFAFGGGRQGSMVANTGEHIVPNFRGGGSAIFNPAMVQANGGLPQGAKKITAAQGYVPNFAMTTPAQYLQQSGSTITGLMRGVKGGTISAHDIQKTNVGSKYGKTGAERVNKMTSKAALARDKAKAKGGIFLRASGPKSLGIGAIVGIQNRANMQQTSTTLGKMIIGEKAKSIKSPRLIQFAKQNPTMPISLSAIPVKGLNRLSKGGDKKALEKDFSEVLNKNMVPALAKYAKSMFGSMMKDDGKAFTEGLSQTRGNVFSTSAEGAIFEAALKVASGQASKFKGDEGARFDFEETGRMDSRLRRFAFKGKHVTRADAKRQDSSPNIASLIPKAFGDALTAPKIEAHLQSRGLLAPPRAKGKRRASGGYVPNFVGRGVPVDLTPFMTKAMLSKKEMGSAGLLGKGAKVGKSMIDKLQKARYTLLAKLGQNKIAQALNWLARHFVTGAAAGLPLAAFVPRAMAEFGVPAVKSAVKIMGNIRSGKSALHGINLKTPMGETAQRGLPTFASGYIPNFGGGGGGTGGGLGAAIGREKAAGVPSAAIRINTSPRFQSPRNPAGLAVTNEIDEPRGLKDVPNFAPAWNAGLDMKSFRKSGLPFNRAGADKWRAKQLKGPGGGMGGMGGMALMMGAPMIGGMAEQAIGGRGGSLTGGFLTGLGTGAGIGSMIAPGPGTAIGAAVGGIGGLATAAIMSAQSLESMSKEMQEFESTVAKTGTAGESYVQAMKDISLATNEKDLASATKDAKAALDALAGTNLEQDFLEAGTNVGEMTKKLEAFATAVSSERKVRRAAVAAESVKTGKGQFFDNKEVKWSQWVQTDLGTEGSLGELKDFTKRMDVFDPKKFASANKDFLKLLLGGLDEEGVKKLQDKMTVQLRSPFTKESTMLKDFQELGGEGIKHLTGAELEAFETFITALDNMSFDLSVGNTTRGTKGIIGSLQELRKHAFAESGKTSIIDNAKKIQTEFLQTMSGFMNPYLKMIEDISSLTTEIDINIAERAAILGGRLSLLSGALSPTEAAGMRRSAGETVIEQKRSTVAAKFNQTNLGKIRGAMETRIGKGAEGFVALAEVLNTFLSGDVSTGLDMLEAKAGQRTGGKVEYAQIQKVASELRIAWDKASAVVDKEERLNRIKFEIERIKARNIERERDAILQQKKIQSGSDLRMAQLRTGADVAAATLQFQLANSRTFQGMTGVEKIDRQSQLEGAIRAINQGVARQQIEEKAKSDALDLKMRDDLLTETRKDVEEKVKLISAIKIETNITEQMITQQKKLVEALKINTQTLIDEGLRSRDIDPEQAKRDAVAAAASKASRLTKHGAASWPQIKGNGGLSLGFTLDPVAGIAGGATTKVIPGTGGTKKGGLTSFMGLPLGTGSGQKGGKAESPTIVLKEIEDARRVLVSLSKSENNSIKEAAKGLLIQLNSVEDINKEHERGQKILAETLDLLKKQQAILDTKFSAGWATGMAQVREEGETIFNLLGEQLPVQLRNGLVSAMEAGLDGAQSIGDAMRAMAVDVLKMIRGAFLQRIATNIVGSIPGGGKKEPTFRGGGLIYAQGGLSVPGSGTGDKIPIMAEPNEYVLNRNAVAAMGGSAALDKINFGAAPRFGGRMALNEDPLSSRMSGLYYATGSPELDELIGAMRAKEEERKAKKAEKRALWTSFATMLASAAVFKGMDVASEKGWFKGDKAWTGPRDFSTKGPIGFDAPASPKKQYGGVVRRYGLGSGYQAGGAVRGLSAPSSNTNNININISTGSNNETEEDGSPQQGGQNINADNGSSSKEFAKRISDAVKRVIAEEQRLGGSLSPGGRRR
jgi:TP901 family phage tail tape measure protein